MPVLVFLIASLDHSPIGLAPEPSPCGSDMRTGGDFFSEDIEFFGAKPMYIVEEFCGRM